MISLQLKLYYTAINTQQNAMSFYLFHAIQIIKNGSCKNHATPPQDRFVSILWRKKKVNQH